MILFYDFQQVKLSETSYSVVAPSSFSDLKVWLHFLFSLVAGQSPGVNNALVSVTAYHTESTSMDRTGMAPSSLRPQRVVKNQLCSTCENRKELITTHQINTSTWQNTNQLLTCLRTTSANLCCFVHRLHVVLYDIGISLCIVLLAIQNTKHFLTQGTSHLFLVSPWLIAPRSAQVLYQSHTTCSPLTFTGWGSRDHDGYLRVEAWLKPHIGAALQLWLHGSSTRSWRLLWAPSKHKNT